MGKTWGKTNPIPTVGLDVYSSQHDPWPHAYFYYYYYYYSYDCVRHATPAARLHAETSRSHTHTAHRRGTMWLRRRNGIQIRMDATDRGEYLSG